MGILKKTKISPIGLDISDISLKAVQLKKNGGKISLHALSHEHLPEGIIEKGVVKDKEFLTKSIRKLLEKSKIGGSFHSDEAVICLPETRTFIKLLKIEKGPNRIEDIIETEIEKNIPVLADEIYYDWEKIKSSEDYDYILAGVAPKKIVDDYLEIASGARLSLLASEIECTSICRTVLKEEAPEPVKNAGNYAIIDVGAARSSLIIYCGNTIVLSVSMPISSHKATHQISRTLEINHQQAEKAKIICGLDETKAQGIVKKILSDMVADLSKKIKEGFDFYNEHYSELGPIDKILLCGGGSNIKNLDGILASETGIETAYSDTFIHLPGSKELFLKHFTTMQNMDLKILKSKESDIISEKQDSSLIFTTAIGLALRNLFTDEI